VTQRAAGLTSVIVAALVAAVLIGSQVFATAGPTTLRVAQPAPAATSHSSDADDTADDADEDDVCATDACGNAHSKAVHAWVKCKADKGKDACVKPAPSAKALGHTRHGGTAAAPARADGHGHGWGRAHAPGQLEEKDKSKSNDDQDDHDPAS